MAHTGRDRGVIYRWAREGRLTRHRGRRGRTLWDLDELREQAWEPGTPFPKPPPRLSTKGGD